MDGALGSPTWWGHTAHGRVGAGRPHGPLQLKPSYNQNSDPPARATRPYGINSRSRPRPALLSPPRPPPLPAPGLPPPPPPPASPSGSAVRPGTPSRGQRGESGREEEAAAAAAADPAALLPSAGAGANFTGAARVPSARPGRTERNGTEPQRCPPRRYSPGLARRGAHLRSRRCSPCCGGSGRARPK